MVETHAMTLRLPENVYEALRNAAFVRRQPMTTIVTEALREHLASFIVEATEEQP
jgi:predicted transcriptional regulator